jgi:hypothetical protein
MRRWSREGRLGEQARVAHCYDQVGDARGRPEWITVAGLRGHPSATGVVVDVVHVNALLALCLDLIAEHPVEAVGPVEIQGGAKGFSDLLHLAIVRWPRQRDLGIDPAGDVVVKVANCALQPRLILGSCPSEIQKSKNFA